MFRPLPLWQSLPCPTFKSGTACSLPHCLFSHELHSASPPQSPPYAPPSPSYNPPSPPYVPPSPPAVLSPVRAPPKHPPPTVARDPRLDRKRRKLTEVENDNDLSSDSSNGGVSLLPTTTIATTTSTTTAATTTVEPAAPPIKKAKTNVGRAGSSSSTAVSGATLKNRKPAATASVRRPPAVPTASPATTLLLGKRSPPEPAHKAPSTSQPLTLNPRLVPNAPESHATRLKLLTLLHTEYVRLHENQSDPQEVLRLALDEEEKVARGMRSIYTQAMKKRIIRMGKTTPADFRKSQEQPVGAVSHTDGMDNNKPPLVTGKTPQGELNALRPLVNPPNLLKLYGYNLEPPTEAEIKAAKDGVESAHGWESCNRCLTRFQVFQGRREDDGRLTSGTKCVYHWGKMVLPPRTGSAYTDVARERYYTCCHRGVSDPGCTTADTHVYKVSEPKRLAATFPYIKTPPPRPTAAAKGGKGVTKEAPVERAVCLDCEMCYTTLGMELIRFTVTAFPSGEVVIDALVQPRGEILDLNTRFSGVSSSDIIAARPHSRIPYPPLPASPSSFINPCTETATPGSPLPILPSPQAARDLLLSYIDSSTPLIGHALENDLHALRLCHDTVIDTAILFPHSRGIPARNKLKWLVETYLKRRIQVEGEGGHDSAVDARCAGEMVRFKIKGR